MRSLTAQMLFSSFSALAAHTWLKPHYGMTNGQLKFHLGLVIPQGPAGRACAHLRVAKDRHAWQLGKLLFFDDSFDHEASERLIDCWSWCECRRRCGTTAMRSVLCSRWCLHTTIWAAMGRRTSAATSKHSFA